MNQIFNFGGDIVTFDGLMFGSKSICCLLNLICTEIIVSYSYIYIYGGYKL